MQRFHWNAEETRTPKKGRWTREEIEWLRDVYGQRDDAAIARELGRTPESVRKMAMDVFRAARAQGPWTSAEVGRLKRSLGISTPEVIALVLGRELDEVRQQVLELGRIQNNGRWTREDLQQLKHDYGTRSDEDLATILGRSVEAIQRTARKLCLAKDKAFLKKQRGDVATRMPRWSESELALLRELYPREANLEIAQRLDRSVKSVVSKAHHLGLRKEIERLREMGRENVRLRYSGRP